MRYVISENRLIELLEAEARLLCLERDGVDNWEWYMESRKEFIAECLDLPVEEVDQSNLDFRDIAMADLCEYEVY